MRSSDAMCWGVISAVEQQAAHVRYFSVGRVLPFHWIQRPLENNGYLSPSFRAFRGM